ncbi:MAG TPA: hypothetical protein VGM10_16855 [Actinocrinis sp.]|jgi:hypothetical protein
MLGSLSAPRIVWLVSMLVVGCLTLLLAIAMRDMASLPQMQVTHAVADATIPGSPTNGIGWD